MKNTITSYLVAALLASCLLLQDENAAIASSLIHEGIVVSKAPIFLADAANAGTDKSKKTPPGYDKPVKGKPLEPKIYKAVKGMVNTSHEGLVEEKTSKGVEMKLKGRFRTAPVATVEDDGSITVRDYTSVPPEEASPLEAGPEE